MSQKNFDWFLKECKNKTTSPAKVKVKSLSRVRLFATPWTVAYEAPPSMGFSRQEYWSGLPCPPPGDLPDSGIEHTSVRSPVLADSSQLALPPGKPKMETLGLQFEM